ncbi:MAG: hypothetical protein ACOY82_02720 [Pseudomonadota bacterium]
MSINHFRSATALRAALLVAGLGLAGLANAQSAACAANEVTQNLDQGANPWTSGSLTYAANIGAGASAVTVNGSITAGNISAGYPQNELTGGLANTFGYAVNRGNTTQTNTITFTFNKPLNNLRLTITDIDRSGTTNAYADQVTITGTAPGGGTVTPTATAATGLVTIAGNVAFPSGTASTATNCPFTNGDCNATFNFSAPITTLTIVYANRAPPAAGNPPEQQVSSIFGGFCVQNPNPSVAKTAPASATVGTAFDFVLRASNPGSAATGTTPTGVQINDTIDANLYTINSITPGAGWACTPNSGFPINAGSTAITCTSAGAIAAGVTNQLAATINITPKFAAMPGPIPNTASIPAGSGGDVDTTNNSSTTSTTLALPQADLTITKTNTPLSGPSDLPADTVVSGATTGYTVVVTNNGPASATGAVIQDAPGTGLTCPPATVVTCTSSAPGACPAGPLTVANLTAGVALGTLPATAGSNTVTFAFACSVQ